MSWNWQVYEARNRHAAMAILHMPSLRMALPLEDHMADDDNACAHCWHCIAFAFVTEASMIGALPQNRNELLPEFPITITIRD